MRSEQIHYFLDVAEMGSMLKVAEKHFLTQPAVSNAISKLEEELGVTLILRSKQGIQLTEAGKIARTQFIQIQQIFAELDEKLVPYKKNMVDETKGLVKLCATVEINNSLIQTVMKHFYEHYPNCTLSVKEYDFLDLVTAVAKKHFEFGVFCIVDDFLYNSTVMQALNQYNLTIEKIGSDSLSVCVSNDSPLAQEDVVSLHTILKHPIAIYSSSDEKCWHDIFLKKYTPKPQLIHSNSTSFLYDLVQNRQCSLFLLNKKNRQALSDNQFPFKLIPVKEKIKVTIGILYKKDPELSELSQKFISFLKIYLKNM